jgi:hypothetical protein
MSSATYTLRLFDTVLTHQTPWKRAKLLHDYDEKEIEIDALVASGDCFVTLATSVEKNANLLTTDTPTVGPGLEKLTSTLLYLQRHYKITRKDTPDYRQ